jgi:hypothetical protein
MKKHPLKETYERSFGRLNESPERNKITYYMSRLQKEVMKLNQEVQANPEFKQNDPIKSGLAGVITAFNKFFEVTK